MKIVFLSFYSGHIYRGVEIFVNELGNRLVRFGNEVVVYQNGPKIKHSLYKTISLDMPVNWQVKSGEVYPPAIPFTDYWGFLLKSFTHQVLKVIDKDVDIIFPTNGGWQILICRLWALKNRKKIVAAGQSGPGFDDRWILWCFPDTFVALTSYHVSWARRANPFVKAEVVPNGVDLDKFRTGIKPLNLKLPKPIILSVAALVPNKRLDLAIKAVSKIKKGSLLLIGQGSHKDNLERLGSKLLPGRFAVLSFPHQDMPKVYSGADLFTFPTVPWESFGIVTVEAMASGLAVVTTEDPIRREIIGDAGLFVDPTDTDAYAKVLEKALKTSWADKPRKQAEKFDWDKIAQKYQEVFGNLFK